MKCHYEILELARDVDDAEIKTAYRKLALKWHPDKNLDNVEFAKEQFQLVKQAYEVLSDHQERAWYDKHREQILFGFNSNYEDNCLDVFQYFTTQCFKGYGDDEKGFYSVYRKVFDEISREDVEYMDSKSDFDQIPVFGTSTSDYEEIVAPFYNYWMSYTTRKSYVWLNPYNINETRERRVLKLIEKENKKVRQQAKKERNEEIRNLVGFVRKRDKRVQVYMKQLEEKNAENRRKLERLRQQKMIERRSEIHTDAQADWSKFDNVKSELKEIEKHLAAEFGENISDSDEISVEENDDFYCVACNKVFKNPKAFGNHESSKKHKENIAKLKVLMQEEDCAFNEEIDGNSSDYEESSIMSSKKQTTTKKKKSRKNKKATVDVEVSSSDMEDEEAFSSKETCSSNKKENNGTTSSDLEEEISSNHETIDSIEKDLNDLIIHEADDGVSSSPEEVTAAPSTKKKNKKNKKVIRIDDDPTIANNEHPEVSDDNFDFTTSKKQKKKTKNKTIQDNSNNKINGTEINGNKSFKVNKNKVHLQTTNLEDIDTSHVCVTCKSNFNSKNKLFEHLKKTGHSVLLHQEKSSTTKSKKKSKLNY